MKVLGSNLVTSAWVPPNWKKSKISILSQTSVLQRQICLSHFLFSTVLFFFFFLECRLMLSRQSFEWFNDEELMDRLNVH